MALGNSLGARRAPDPAEFVAGKARHEDDVQRPVGGGRTVEHLVGDAPATAEFHRPRVDLVHLRRRDRAVGLLDEFTADATPAEVAGEGEPDRPAADDQNGDVTTFPARHLVDLYAAGLGDLNPSPVLGGDEGGEIRG